MAKDRTIKECHTVDDAQGKLCLEMFTGNDITISFTVPFTVPFTVSFTVSQASLFCRIFDENYT